MKRFLDTNVFVFGFLFSESNSRIILNLAEEKEFEVIVSELVLEEVARFFLREYSKKEAYNALKYVETLSKRIVPREEVKEKIQEFKGAIVEKDLDNIATAKYEKVDYLIAYDRHYEKFEEYKTPKQFLKMIKLKTFESEY